MERVQFQQEQMLDELKDLMEKNLFTDYEIKQIIRKRTAFEMTLVRRVAKKADFLRYLSYEMGLEQLRRKRVERMKLVSSSPSISDYALVRRQFQIFERALKRFKSDVSLWIQYIKVAKKEGARSLVGRITARAIQLHPNEPILYILAASHELDHQSHSAARTLLQRGLRLNKDSVELWREYVKMELGFIESLRRRWDVLGILGKEDEVNGADDVGRDECTDGLEENQREGVASSRDEILEGAIVRAVVTNAIREIPKLELFEELHGLVSGYPSQPRVKEALLQHLYEQLRRTVPASAGVAKLLAGRFISGELQGLRLVEELKATNMEMVEFTRKNQEEEIAKGYATFVEVCCCGSKLDENLKEYLISFLRSVGQQKGRRSPSLFAAEIKLRTRLAKETSTSGIGDSVKILNTARKYTGKTPTSAEVWLARLEAEKSFASVEEVELVWKEAQRSVIGTEEEELLVREWRSTGP